MTNIFEHDFFADYDWDHLTSGRGQPDTIKPPYLPPPHSDLKVGLYTQSLKKKTHSHYTQSLKKKTHSHCTPSTYFGATLSQPTLLTHNITTNYYLITFPSPPHSDLKVCRRPRPRYTLSFLPIYASLCIYPHNFMYTFFFKLILS